MIAGELEYLFKHVLIRDVAYSQLPKRRRSACTRGLRTGSPGCRGRGRARRVRRVPPRTGLPDRKDDRSAGGAAARGEGRRRAGARGGKSERREGFREAERFYTRALELADGLDEGTRAELRYRRARMLVGRGALGQAQDELADVLEVAASVGRLELRCAALLTLANLEWKQGRAGDERDHLIEAEQIAEQIGDRRLGIITAFEFANLRGWFEARQRKRSTICGSRSRALRSTATARCSRRRTFAWGQP
jgi:tetratricopeptide (TPR) repeat protein